MHPLSEDVTTEDGKVLSSPAVTSVYNLSKILFCYMWPFFLFNFYIVNPLTSCYFSGWKRDLLLFWLNCGARRGSAPRTAPGAEGAATLEHPPSPTPLFPAPAGQGRTKTSIEARVCSLAFPLAPRPWCGTATLNGLPQWLPNNLPRPCKVSKLALSPYSTLWTDFTFRDCTKTRKLCWRFKGKEADSRLQRERETSRPDRVGGVVYNFTPELNNFRFLAQCRAITP